MLQILLVGLYGLLVSQVEGWTYLDGIYLAVVTSLTVGYVLGPIVVDRPATATCHRPTP